MTSSIKLSNCHKQILLSDSSPSKIVQGFQLFKINGLLYKYSEYLSVYSTPITLKLFSVVIGAVPVGVIVLLQEELLL